MAGFLDNTPVKISCEKCGCVVNKTFGWLKANDHLICVCGVRIGLNVDKFKRGLASAERGRERLKSALKKIGKDHKG